MTEIELILERLALEDPDPTEPSTRSGGWRGRTARAAAVHSFVKTELGREVY